MRDTIIRFLAAIPDQLSRRAIRVPVESIGDRMSSQPLTSAGLVISAGGSALAKTGASDFYASVNGILVKIASGTNMPALTSAASFAAGSFNVVCFVVDSAGTVTMLPGAQGTTLAKVIFPEFGKNKALVGFLIITYASAFVGGTTPLDTATTVYVSPLGAFDPTILTG